MCTGSMRVQVLLARASKLSWKAAAPWTTSKFSQTVGQHELLRHCNGKNYAKVVPGSIQPGMSKQKLGSDPGSGEEHMCMAQ